MSRLFLTLVLFCAPSFAQQITWAQQTPGSPWPNARGWLQPNYDSLNNRTLFYMADNESFATGTPIYANSVWSYNSATNAMVKLWTSGTVSVDCTGGTAPLDRHPYFQTAWDSTRNRLWLYGGVCAGTSRTDTWYFEPTASAGTWTQVSPVTNPTERLESAMVYDPDQDVLVLYGGLSPSSADNQTWLYCFAVNAGIGCANANDWNQITTTGDPANRARHGLVYDAANKRVLLFAGYVAIDTTPQDPPETWAYDVATKTWTDRSPSGNPGATLQPGMTYDPLWRSVILHRNQNETWVYSYEKNLWTELSVSGNGPDRGSCASCQGATFDLNARKAVVWNKNNDELWLGTVATKVFAPVLR